MQQVLDRLVVLLMLAAMYYNWYRYPFRINASGTSPTYADTPGWLSLGKYVVVAALLGWALLRRARGPAIRLPSPVTVALHLFLCVVPVVAGLAVARSELVESGIFFVVPLVLFCFTGWSVSVSRVDRAVVWIVYLGLLVTGIQLFLFFAFGRLPALAFANSISVRFGSFLDDPNGWGIVAIWLFFFALYRWTGWRRVVLAGGLFLTLLLTQSLTAVGAFCVTFAVFSVIAIFSRAATFYRAVTAVLVLSSVVVAVFVTFETEITVAARVFMATKQGSMEQHSGALDMLQLASPLGLLGVQPSPSAWGESTYSNALVNLGLLYPLVFVWVGVGAMLRYLRLLRHPGAGRETRAFAAGGLALLVSMYAGSFTLPFMEGYPINLLAGLFIGLASGGLLPRGAPSGIRPALRQHGEPTPRPEAVPVSGAP